jgi:hypothetical protein
VPCPGVSAGEDGAGGGAVRIILGCWRQRPKEWSQPIREVSRVQSGRASGVSGWWAFSIASRLASASARGVDLGGGHIGVAEQIADVDQVDAGADQVHRPGAPQRVRRDRQPGSQAEVARSDGPHVTGKELGEAGPGQSGVVGPVEQRIGVGTEAGVGVAALEVVGDEPGGWVHHGTYRILEPFPRIVTCKLGTLAAAL